MPTNTKIEKFNSWRTKNLKPQHFRLLLSIIIGVLSGLTAVTLKNCVHFTQVFLTEGFAKEYYNYYYFVYPFLGLFLTYLFMKYVMKNPILRGVPGILWVIKKEKSVIHLSNTFGTIIASVFTVGFGGSVGLEGPTASASSSIASFLGRKLNLDTKTITLLIGCSATGALAGIFNAPIAALVLVLEIFLFDLTITSMIPFLAASVSGALTSRLILGNNVLFNIELTEKFIISQVPFFILLGIFTGLVSVYFNRVFWYTDLFFDKISLKFNKLLVGGILLGFIVFVFPPLYGEGFETIKALLSGNVDTIFNNSFVYDYRENTAVAIILLIILVLFKAFATSFTIKAGGVEGIFAPSLFFGSLTGFIFAKTINYFHIANLSEKNFTLVGMAGLIAGVLHAPLTSLFLIAEITTGYELIIPLMIVATVSYLTSKFFVKESVYTMQLAKRGQIHTHHKDKTVLTMINLKEEIETEFNAVKPNDTLRKLLDVVTISKRNIFPVLDKKGNFKGVVTLDNIREIMFKPELYDVTLVKNLMFTPLESVSPDEDLESVMGKFNETKYWNLPVLENQKYIGFISKSKLFNAYREKLIYNSED